MVLISSVSNMDTGSSAESSRIVAMRLVPSSFSPPGVHNSSNDATDV
jgi:hypothetical protein